MRKLAAEPGANPMSLCHHVEKKESLLRGVAALVGAEFHLPPPRRCPGRNGCADSQPTSAHWRTATQI